MFYRRLLGIALVSVAMAVGTASPDAQAPVAQSGSAEVSAAVLKQYCVTCHNERLKTGGLVIDPTAVANVNDGADRWEKVVRKLRSQSMCQPSRLGVKAKICP